MKPESIRFADADEPDPVKALEPEEMATDWPIALFLREVPSQYTMSRNRFIGFTLQYLNHRFDYLALGVTDGRHHRWEARHPAPFTVLPNIHSDSLIEMLSE